MANTVAAQSAAKYTKPLLTLKLDGKIIPSSNATLTKGDSTYVSLRSVGEWLNYTVSWDVKTKTLQLKNKSETIKVTGDKKDFTVNGKKHTNDKAAAYANSKIYVNTAFLEKYLRCTASFDKTKNQISIIKKAQTSTTTTIATQSKVVNILGKKIKEPLIIKSNIVYLPMRAIGESLGYKVDYNAKTKTMILKNKNTIKIVIDKVDGSVDGKSVKLDKAPFISNGSAYVPITFIQKNFDYETKFNEKEQLVSINQKVLTPVTTPVVNIPESSEPANILNIAYDDNIGFPQLNISADKSITYSSFTLSNPDRMVIDIKNAFTQTGFEEKDINQGDILKVRVAQFSMDPNVVRVVVDLKSQYNCKLLQSEDKKTVSLLYGNTIQPVTYVNEKNYDVFTIKGINNIESTVEEIDGPQRLVFDIKDGILDTPDQVINCASQYVKTMRTGQYELGTARVVLELMPGVFYDVKTENNVTRLYVSNIPFSIIDYKKGYNSAIVNLNVGKVEDFQTTYDEATNTIIATSTKELNAEARRYNINDNLVEYFEVLKDKKDGNDITTVNAKLKSNIKYNMTSSNDGTLKIVLDKIMDKPQDIVIIIDPGHGGKDPGAVAKDGTREKDLNLDVAKRLNEKLLNLGFKTKMTRTEDVYVSLQERAVLANTNFADFYLSIHFNAFNEKTQGIETLYYPNTPTEIYSINNKDVASIFHKEVTSKVNTTSRGITQRPGLYVLNKTKMPAILTELGFMTNPQELKQMKTAEYRESSSKALTASIVRYFNEVERANLDINIADIYAGNSMTKTEDGENIAKND